MAPSSSTAFAEEYAQEIRENASLTAAVELARQSAPSRFFVPSERQRAYLAAPHVVRVLATGNGFGKTTLMALDANARATHSSRWQESPDWPQIMLWFAPQKAQFAFLRPQLEEDVFGDQCAWKPPSGDLPGRYEWPDGSRLYLVSYGKGEGTWKGLQGINPDVIYFDENPPHSLWREMRMRRRGKRKTRFVLAATQTEGRTWPAKEFYEPWKARAVADGLSVEEMRERQTHPWAWIADRGGHWDNPSLSDADHEWYEAQVWPGGQREREVRMNGGFADWSAAEVFDHDALRRLRDILPDLDDLHGAMRTGFFRLVSAAGYIGPAGDAAGATRRSER
jgi:hypothetical protein